MPKVSIFIPCFMDQLYPGTAVSMVKVLRKLGCEVVYNTKQTCCGQPAYNAGYANEAMPVCEKFLEDFKDADIIVTPSGSCAGFIKNYYSKMFKGTPLAKTSDEITAKVWEFTDFITTKLDVVDVGATFKGIGTYHDACGALRECGIKDAPRMLLEKVKGLQMVEMNECETCCGFGGTFAVKFEPISIAMAEQKVINAMASGARFIISTDISCLMHIGGYIAKKNLPIQVVHIADVLASEE